MAEHCRTWDGDAAWGGTVPLGLYAQAVHSVCGFVLSEHELRQLLRALHPEVGEPPGGKNMFKPEVPAARPLSPGQAQGGLTSSLGQPAASSPGPRLASLVYCLATPAQFPSQVRSCASS